MFVYSLYAYLVIRIITNGQLRLLVSKPMIPLLSLSLGCAFIYVYIRFKAGFHLEPRKVVL